MTTPPATKEALRVLLVEDHDRMRAILSSRLRGAMHATVEATADIDAALMILADQPMDVVVMDVNIAGRSSVDALPEVKVRAPGARVVLMSAEATSAVERRALAQGADIFIAKSAGLDDLCQAVDPTGQYSTT